MNKETKLNKLTNIQFVTIKQMYKCKKKTVLSFIYDGLLTLMFR